MKGGLQVTHLLCIYIYLTQSSICLCPVMSEHVFCFVDDESSQQSSLKVVVVTSVALYVVCFFLYSFKHTFLIQPNQAATLKKTYKLSQNCSSLNGHYRPAPKVGTFPSLKQK